MLIPRRISPLVRQGRKKGKSQRESDINLVLSAFRSFRSISPVGYLSTPITTGELFYSILEKYQVQTLKELTVINKDIIFDEIISPNAESGIILGDQLAAQWNIPIIVPAVFEAKSHGWTEADYMDIWYQVIKEMVGHTIMRDGWQYSDGGTKEFLYSMEMKYRLKFEPQLSINFPNYVPITLPPAKFPTELIIISNQRGEEISLEAGAKMISLAIINLCQRGFMPKDLLAVLLQILGIAQAELQLYDKVDTTIITKYWREALLTSKETESDIYTHCLSQS